MPRSLNLKMPAALIVGLTLCSSVFFLGSCSDETPADEPKVHSGFDLQGEPRSCKDPGLIACTRELNVIAQSFRESCEESGHTVFDCGCQDYICSGRITPDPDPSQPEPTLRDIYKKGDILEAGLTRVSLDADNPPVNGRVTSATLRVDMTENTVSLILRPSDKTYSWPVLDVGFDETCHQTVITAGSGNGDSFEGLRVSDPATAKDCYFLVAPALEAVLTIRNNAGLSKSTFADVVTLEPVKAGDPGVVEHQGYDFRGQSKKCTVPANLEEVIACTLVYTESDAWASSCREAGYEPLFCGCHDWLCPKNISAVR